jgi:transposase
MLSCMKRQSGLTATTEQWRRQRAVQLRQENWTLSAIAEAIGVTPGAVSQWLTAAQEQGPQALLSQRSRTGRRPKLTAEQTTRLLELLDQGAETWGYVGEQWHGKRVADLIYREFKVAYVPTSIPRLLRRLGWSPQKPQVLASQRDEKKIAHFQQEWSTVKKGHKPRVAPSSL